ncbi:hypothetical protein [Selenihalanaerobacter shriftii]|uniref:Helix-turn-helix domain-containing protein n=1 Tax=Selenihalanaerobacter shriftii TaxID=142842 RepID=A0A1T4NUQ2_9FIRM|nr:hypothetical protein [Selenihalanaerobacter shriftii]SJZ82875.1 hypothetical protein SAMN02745118_01928 [Selenihalanaerobacter shriftii]
MWKLIQEVKVNYCRGLSVDGHDIYLLREFNGKLGKCFFDIKDVKKVTKMKENSITRTKAANIIEVARRTIIKWKNKGKLNAISGSSIDWFGKYLYSKGDVEKLRKEYSQ